MLALRYSKVVSIYMTKIYFPRYSEFFWNSPYILEYNLKAWKKEYVDCMKKFIQSESIENPTMDLKTMDFVQELYFACHIENMVEKFYNNWVNYVLDSN